jgi:hypothetical protein
MRKAIEVVTVDVDIVDRHCRLLLRNVLKLCAFASHESTIIIGITIKHFVMINRHRCK